MLSKLVREQSAPQVDMEPFEGNPVDFIYFMSMFQEPVEKKIDDPRGRLTRLIKYTRGDPRELVKYFINDRADCGYKNAIALLQKQYGNRHTLLSSYRKEIKLMQPLKPGDAAAFWRLFNFLIKCQTMGVGSKHNPLDTPEIICMILAKLPLHLQDRWNRNTLLLRRRDSREPTLIDLANFVEDEMTLVNDPLYSREAVSQYLEKGPTRQGQRGDRRKFHTMATKTNNSSESMQKGNKMSNERTCPVCGEKHDIEDCKYYLQQTLEERSKLIFKKKLCYGCFQEIKKDHNANNCSKRRFCNVCNGKHPTTLHGFVRKKVDNTQHQRNSEASEERNDGDVAACASLNTGMEVISMCVVPVKLRHGDSGETLKTYALLDNCSQGTFILERLLKRFGIKGRKTSINIKTLNGEVTNKSSMINGLKVASSRNSSEDWLELPDTYTKKYLPVGKEDVATPSKLKKMGTP